MFIKQSLFRYLEHLSYRQIASVRNIQISVIGAGNEVGSNLSLLLKTNKKVTRLNLYDDHDKINGLALELNNIPGGPVVEAFSGDQQLAVAIRDSKLITMVNRIPQRYCTTLQQKIIESAPAIQKVCRVIACHNPDALFAISTDPLNCTVPFASALLSMYNCYNPFRVFGITHIDTARSRAYAAKILNLDPEIIQVPVIGGHSAKTIIPLFSNLQSSCDVSTDQADMLTRLVRNAERDVMINKQATESATLAVAWSIHEFIDSMLYAIQGQEVTVNTYCTNLLFGTRYFSGPVKVGADGITETICDFNINDYERELLRIALPIIHENISQGEEYVGVVKSLGQFIP